VDFTHVIDIWWEMEKRTKNYGCKSNNIVIILYYYHFGLAMAFKKHFGIMNTFQPTFKF
jgi:hypothetical protein